jgi:integrase
MQKEIRDFLESITSHNTRKGYLRGLGLFEEFSGRSLQETLRLRKKDKERNLEREVERFYTWIIEVKKLNPNTAYNCVVALKSLMTFYNVSLKLKRGSCSRIPTMPQDWIPSIEELGLMFNIGDLREKLIISLAKDIPLRVNDFLRIQKENVASGNTTFILRTQKTKTPMQCFLSSESIDLLKIYLSGQNQANSYLFEGKHGRLNDAYACMCYQHSRGDR